MNPVIADIKLHGMVSHLSPSEHRLAVGTGQVGVQCPFPVISLYWGSHCAKFNFLIATSFMRYVCTDALTYVALICRKAAQRRLIRGCYKITWPCYRHWKPMIKAWVRRMFSAASGISIGPIWCNIVALVMWWVHVWLGRGLFHSNK